MAQIYEREREMILLFSLMVLSEEVKMFHSFAKGPMQFETPFTVLHNFFHHYCH